MMHVKSIYLFAALIILAGACGPSQEELAHTAEDRTWAEMMKIHDEVMPKTSEIVALYTKLKTMDLQNSAITEWSDEIQKRISVLEEAEEAMFAWMNDLKNLNVLRPQKDHDEIMEYLNLETQKIVSIRNQMIVALEEGNVLLNKLSK